MSQEGIEETQELNSYDDKNIVTTIQVSDLSSSSIHPLSTS